MRDKSARSKKIPLDEDKITLRESIYKSFYIVEGEKRRKTRVTRRRIGTRDIEPKDRQIDKQIRCEREKHDREKMQRKMWRVRTNNKLANELTIEIKKNRYMRMEEDME